MLAPDVEARFRKIEDDLAVAAELLRRFERRTEERLGHVEAVEDAMARWQDKMADRQDEMEAKQNLLVDAQIEMRQALAELARTVDRFLKARSNGGQAH
jgi:chromosome segregation ATPase